jgi:hypothetical protein
MAKKYAARYREIEAMPVRTIRGYANNWEVEKRTRQWIAKAEAVEKIENQILHNEGFNPFIMSHDEKTHYLSQIQAAISAGTMTIAETTVAPGVAPISALHELARGTIATPTTKQPIPNIVEYLPFVGIGIGLFRLFFR